MLSRRILVTESLPLPIRGPATKKFEFTKLLQVGQSKTLQNQSLTVQMVSQPGVVRGAGAAVPDGISLRVHRADLQPALRQRPGAAHRQQRPKIRRIFDQWKNTPALDSPLEKNQDLKAVMLEETPWLRQAADRKPGAQERGHPLRRQPPQRRDARGAAASWPRCSWATAPGRGSPAGRANDYITLYITTGFGRLRHLGVKHRHGPGRQVARTGWTPG